MMPDNTHSGPALSSPAWRFRELKNAHRQAVDASMAENGVGELGQPFILFTLCHVESGCLSTQKELADRLGVSPATLTASLKALEKKGCIRRAEDKDDMRRKRIEITEQGRELTKKCGLAFSHVDEVMYDGFSEEELSVLSVFFERMTKNLRSVCQNSKGCCL